MLSKPDHDGNNVEKTVNYGAYGQSERNSLLAYPHLLVKALANANAGKSPLCGFAPRSKYLMQCADIGEESTVVMLDDSRGTQVCFSSNKHDSKKWNKIKTCEELHAVPSWLAEGSVDSPPYDEGRLNGSNGLGSGLFGQ